MPREMRLAVVIVLFALGAGCGGVGDEAPDREPYGVDETVDSSIAAETVTSADADTDANTGTGTKRRSGEFIQAGLTTDGIVDERAFFENYRTVVENRTHTYLVEKQYVDESRTVHGKTEQLVRVDPADERVFVIERTTSVETRPEEPVVREYWIEDGRSVERVDPAEGSVEYGRGWPRQVRTAPVWVVYALAATENATVTELDETTRIDGRTSGPLYPFDGDETIDVRLTVEGDGLIRQYELEGVTDRYDLELRYAERVTYVDVGETTVERPEWVEEATAELETPAVESRAE